MVGGDRPRCCLWLFSSDFKNDHMELNRLNQVIVQMFRRSVGEELLTGCDITWQPGACEIVIVCSSEEQAEKLIIDAVKLVLPIQGYVRKITILGEKFDYSFSPHVVTQLEPELMLTEADLKQKIITVPDEDLIREVLAYPKGAGITRMKDHKGLFCNNVIHLSSGANSNDWTGTNMRNHHIPDELSRYLTALYRDIDINIEYTAPLFDGRLCLHKVMARLVWYRGELCRLVKVENCTPLS
jgi:hypothetical protein